MRKVLVVAAHPDDEVLGCGATIAGHAAAGDEVHVAILAEGATSRGPTRDRNAFEFHLASLGEAASRSAEILGVASITLHQLPDNRMDGLERLDIVKIVESTVERLRPAIVYTHHPGDLNVDHRRCSEAVVTACRPTPDHPVRSILFFEVPSSTEWSGPLGLPPFQPNWFVDVTATYPKKAEALRCYQTEMRAWPNARSFEAVEALAAWRGATAGAKRAEAFVLGRALVRNES